MISGTVIKVQAQLDNTTINKVKVIYLNAENKYKSGSYSACLDKIAEIESLTDGLRIPTAQNLKVKALIGAKKYSKAQEELELLQSLELSDEIIQDIAKYSDEIENYFEKVTMKPVKMTSAFDTFWADKNLNVTTFRNGDKIPEARSEDEMNRYIELKKPAFAYHEFNKDNLLKHGVKYNVYAIKDPRGLAPEGWRIANTSDWTDLINYLSINVELPKFEIIGYLSSTGREVFSGSKKTGFYRNNPYSKYKRYYWRVPDDTKYGRFIVVNLEKNEINLYSPHVEDKLVYEYNYVRCVKE